jgi:hypothetical protein
MTYRGLLEAGRGAAARHLRRSQWFEFQGGEDLFLLIIHVGENVVLRGFPPSQPGKTSAEY